MTTTWSSSLRLGRACAGASCIDLEIACVSPGAEGFHLWCATAEVLQAKWKEWMTEALGELGAVPAGNAPGNREWLTRKRRTPAGWDKPELVVGDDGSVEERLTTLLATHDVVAFIKGTRQSPECTFSQSMVTMLHVRVVGSWLSDSPRPLPTPLPAGATPSTTARRGRWRR